MSNNSPLKMANGQLSIASPSDPHQNSQWKETPVPLQEEDLDDVMSLYFGDEDEMELEDYEIEEEEMSPAKLKELQAEYIAYLEAGACPECGGIGGCQPIPLEEDVDFDVTVDDDGDEDEDY